MNATYLFLFEFVKILVGSSGWVDFFWFLGGYNSLDIKFKGPVVLTYVP